MRRCAYCAAEVDPENEIHEDWCQESPDDAVESYGTIEDIAYEELMADDE